MFPVSNKAQDVVDTLVQQIKNNQVKLMEETPVTNVSYENDIFNVKTQNGEFQSHSLLLLAVLQYLKLDQQVTAISLPNRWVIQSQSFFPTEVPITSNEPFIKSKQLKGLSLKMSNYQY